MATNKVVRWLRSSVIPKEVAFFIVTMVVLWGGAALFLAKELSPPLKVELFRSLRVDRRADQGTAVYYQQDTKSGDCYIIFANGQSGGIVSLPTLNDRCNQAFMEKQRLQHPN